MQNIEKVEKSIKLREMDAIIKQQKEAIKGLENGLEILERQKESFSKDFKNYGFRIFRR